MAEKQLIVVVESTAAIGPYWDTLLMDYLDKIIRCFGGSDSTGQKPSVSNVEFALVTYNTHGCYSGCLVQRTGWTRDPDVFFLWLSAIPFTGGGFNDAAIAEGLAEALMMFPNSQSGGPNQQNVDMHKHCILISASNPYPLQTPIFIPRLQNLEQSESIESDPGNRLYDAEAVAKAFPQFSVSLSIICPKQLPKVKAIYNATRTGLMAHWDHPWMTRDSGFPLTGKFEFEFVDPNGWLVDPVTRFSIYTGTVSVTYGSGQGAPLGLVGTFRAGMTLSFLIGHPDGQIPPM